MMVLLRWRDRSDGDPYDVQVDSIHADATSVRARLAGIRKANPEYPLTPDLGRPIGFGDGECRNWTIGPVEDEGFFGNRPMRFRLVRPVWPRSGT